MNHSAWTGVYPIAPTAFTASGELDDASNRRVMDCMIDQGVNGICILANYSEQFALTDREREHLLEISTNQIAGRVPIIVTTSHYATAVAVQRAQQAEAAGANMLMMMPPYHGTAIRAGDDGIFEHFQAVSGAVSIPIMIQDAPLSGVAMSIDLLVRMARELANVSYFKIEMPGTADKLRALIKAGGEAIVGPYDGEESITLMADLDAGATGTMPSAMMPDQIKPVVEHYLAGREDDAAKAYARILPLINYENRQCNLRATKAVFLEGGVIASDLVRHPFTPLPDASRAGLLKLVREINPVALTWGT